MTIVADTPMPVDVFEVTLGVDTHADFHVAAVIDPLGRHLGQASFDTNVAGFKALLAWVNNFGPISIAGVEGTGAYGAGLARFLTAHDVTVVEVDRPDRKTRRDQGKSDPIDAYAAARAAASGRASGTPKTRTGDVESVRVLRVARTGAVRARARALTQLKSLIVVAASSLSVVSPRRNPLSSASPTSPTRQTPPRSNSVRAGVVTAIPFTTVRSIGSNAFVSCTRTPSRRVRRHLGHMISTTSRRRPGNPWSSAADR